MRSSISAQSVASVPPAPALIVTSAPRWSYSPEKSSAVRSRSNETRSASASRSISASISASSASAARSISSSRPVARDSRSRQSRELAAQPVGLAKDSLRSSLVVPESRDADQRVELRDARFLGREVKDAPRSRGSVSASSRRPARSI